MSQRRYELTDFEWSIIEPLLPNKPRGVPRVDDRKVLNGSFWRLRTGSRALRPADDLLQPLRPLAPDRPVGPDFRSDLAGLRLPRPPSRGRRSANGRLLFDPRASAWWQCQKGGAHAAAGDISHARCMGRSRGGLTTKIHALVDANGLPVALKLSEGQAHDGRSARDMLVRIGRGQILLADRAYDSDALRVDLATRGAWANIKPMPGRKRIPAFSRFLYRYRNLVERFFNKLKHFRAIATRYEKHDANDLALIKLASFRI